MDSIGKRFQIGAMRWRETEYIMGNAANISYLFPRVFYWFGAYYSTSLLVQAVIMIVVQLILLKVALDNRPPLGVKDGLEHAPFSGYASDAPLTFTRPYSFWQWRSSRPYVFVISFGPRLLPAPKPRTCANISHT